MCGRRLARLQVHPRGRRQQPDQGQRLPDLRQEAVGDHGLPAARSAQGHEEELGLGAGAAPAAGDGPAAGPRHARRARQTYVHLQRPRDADLHRDGLPPEGPPPGRVRRDEPTVCQPAVAAAVLRSCLCQPAGRHLQTDRRGQGPRAGRGPGHRPHLGAAARRPLPVHLRHRRAREPGHEGRGEELHHARGQRALAPAAAGKQGRRPDAVHTHASGEHHQGGPPPAGVGQQGHRAGHLQDSLDELRPAPIQAPCAHGALQRAGAALQRRGDAQGPLPELPVRPRLPPPDL
mmetsp:Transcript_61815/g.184144  ORF Transcript_61815/g.184144 Transcript_61815/m.184144 type:complete len:290 (+) Transcript_61815:543-1412(+)